MSTFYLRIAMLAICVAAQPGDEIEIAPLVGHEDSIMGVSFSADGARLASCSRDGTIRLWSVSQRKVLLVLRAKTWWSTAVCFSPNGRALAGSYADGTIYLWDSALREPVRELKGHKKSVNDLSFSPDGRMLASAGADAKICIWDVPTGRALRVLAKHTDEVSELGFSHDGATLASVGADDTLRVWDVHSGGQRFVHHAAPNAVVAFSHDDVLLASGGDESAVRLWDVRSGKERAILKSRSERIRCLVFSSDRQHFFASGYETLDAWDTEKFAELSSSEIPAVTYTDCLISLRDEQLVSAYGNGEIAWWKGKPPLIKPERQVNLKHGRIVTLAGSPQGERLAAGCWDGTVVLVHRKKAGATVPARSRSKAER
jgi:WD40 repeat protein